MGEGDLMDSLWWAGIEPGTIGDIIRCRGIGDMGSAGDQDLLLMSAIELVDFHHLEDAAQARSLHWLNKLALDRPGVFLSL